MGILSKIIRNIIRKAIGRNQNPEAKLCPNQQESTKHRAFCNCTLLIVSLYKLKKKFVIFYVRMMSHL